MNKEILKELLIKKIGIWASCHVPTIKPKETIVDIAEITSDELIARVVLYVDGHKGQTQVLVGPNNSYKIFISPVIFKWEGEMRSGIDLRIQGETIPFTIREATDEDWKCHDEGDYGRH